MRLAVSDGRVRVEGGGFLRLWGSLIFSLSEIDYFMIFCLFCFVFLFVFFTEKVFIDDQLRGSKEFTSDEKASKNSTAKLDIQIESDKQQTACHNMCIFIYFPRPLLKKKVPIIAQVSNLSNDIS